MGKAQLKSLIAKGTSIARIILSLSGSWWDAHPSILLSLYRSVFRDSIEYGAQVFGLTGNQGLWKFREYNTVLFEQPWVCDNLLLSVFF